MGTPYHPDDEFLVKGITGSVTGGGAISYSLISLGTNLLELFCSSGGALNPNRRTTMNSPCYATGLQCDTRAACLVFRFG